MNLRMLLLLAALFTIEARADYLSRSYNSGGMATLSIVGGTPGGIVDELYEILGKTGYPVDHGNSEPSCLSRTANFYDSGSELFLFANFSQGCHKFGPGGEIAVPYGDTWDWIGSTDGPEGKLVTYGAPYIGAMRLFNLLVAAGFPEIPVNGKAVRVASHSILCVLEDKSKPEDRYQYYCRVTVPVRDSQVFAPLSASGPRR